VRRGSSRIDLVVWKVCVDLESGMPEGPESRMEEDVYIYIHIYIYIYGMHRKSQLYLLNFVIPIV
jgi:hypothetical protein